MSESMKTAAMIVAAVAALVLLAFGVRACVRQMDEDHRQNMAAWRAWNVERAKARHRVTLGDRVWIARGYVEETAWFDRCYSFTDDATGLRVDVVGPIVVERIK